jgi:hypothetical protein
MRVRINSPKKVFDPKKLNFFRREANLTSIPLALIPIFDVLSQQIEVLPLDVPDWSEKECLQNAPNHDDSQSELNESITERVPAGAFCMTWPVFILGAMVFSIVSSQNNS